jgi:hypothetical protein
MRYSGAVITRLENVATGVLDGALRRAARVFASRGSRALVVAVWALFAVAAGVQRLAEPFLAARPGDVLLFRQDLWLLALWALATPAIVWSARRYPVRGASAVPHAVLHFVAATFFIVATNVLIRLPLLQSPEAAGAHALARSTLLGLARFYPPALLVYGVIVALGAGAWVAAASEPRTTHPDRVVVREWNRVHLVRPGDIEWIEADDNYVVVHVSGRTYKARGRIGDLETQLDPSCFVRIHRSAIVRVASVREVQPLGKGDYSVILHGGKVLRAARGRRSSLETALGLPL